MRCKGADGKRVYVYEAKEKQRGANIVKDAQKIRDHIAENPGITKAAVLEFKKTFLV